MLPQAASPVAEAMVGRRLAQVTGTESALGSEPATTTPTTTTLPTRPSLVLLAPRAEPTASAIVGRRLQQAEVCRSWLSLLCRRAAPALLRPPVLTSRPFPAPPQPMLPQAASPVAEAMVGRRLAQATGTESTQGVLPATTTPTTATLPTLPSLTRPSLVLLAPRAEPTASAIVGRRLAQATGTESTLGIESILPAASVPVRTSPFVPGPPVAELLSRPSDGRRLHQTESAIQTAGKLVGVPTAESLVGRKLLQVGRAGGPSRPAAIADCIVACALHLKHAVTPACTPPTPPTPCHAGRDRRPRHHWRQRDVLGDWPA